MFHSHVLSRRPRAQVVTIAEALAEVNPRARLLLMLRDPLSRLWSDFFYFAHHRERDLPLPAESEVNATHFHRCIVYCVEASGFYICSALDPISTLFNLFSSTLLHIGTLNTALK